MAAWYLLGQDQGYPSPGSGMPIDLIAVHEITVGKSPSSKPILLQSAIEGHVLVKNVNNTLPLKSPQLLSLFGYDGKAPDQNDVSSGTWVPWTLGFESANILEAEGGFLGEAPIIPASQIAINGTIISGGGSGANSPAYINAPFDALQQQAYEDGTALFWDFINTDPVVEGASDACIVFINAFASEGIDRVGLHDDYSDALVNNV